VSDPVKQVTSCSVAQKTGQPFYLRDLLHYHQPARTLEIQSTTTLSAGDKDQFSIQGIQYHGTSCLELSVSSY